MADGKKQLTYSLDRSGMLDSSAQSANEAELKKLSTGTAARSRSWSAKSDVESARSNLRSTVSSTGNAYAAANSAST